MSSSMPPDRFSPEYDPRPWWHRDLDDRIEKRFNSIERLQRVQTIAFITGAPMIAAAGWLAGRFQSGAAPAHIFYGVLQVLMGWAL